MTDHIATPYPMSANHRYGIRLTLKACALAAMACFALTACSGLGSSASAVNPVNWITPYKMDVIQGNFISSEQVELLKAGMTRAQETTMHYRSAFRPALFEGRPLPPISPARAFASTAAVRTRGKHGTSKRTTGARRSTGFIARRCRPC